MKSKFVLTGFTSIPGQDEIDAIDAACAEVERLSEKMRVPDRTLCIYEGDERSYENGIAIARSVLSNPGEVSECIFKANVHRCALASNAYGPSYESQLLRLFIFIPFMIGAVLAGVMGKGILCGCGAILACSMLYLIFAPELKAYAKLKNLENTCRALVAQG